MKRQSTKAGKRKAAAEYFEDAHGVRYWEVAGLLGNPKDWAAIRRVVAPSLSAWFRCEHVTNQCWLCENRFGMECHHIVGGGRKSDELCNFLWVCRLCHAVVQSQPAELKRVFRAKVKHDKANTDWLRLVRLYGSIPFDTLD